MVSTLVVSDIRIYREGLREVLARSGRISVTGVAASMADTMDCLRRTPADVVLLDMGTVEALTLTQTVVDRYSQIKVVAVGLTECKKDIIACAEAGISGYVSKDGSADDVINAVLRAVQGELACPAQVAAVLLQRLRQLARDKKAHDGQDSLTPRELEVAELLGRGLSNTEIASLLRIRPATTKTHVHHVLGKLGARRRGQVVVHLQERGRSNFQGNADQSPRCHSRESGNPGSSTASDM
jgi:DNA-binding NarL/FixJ family response regulator